MQNLSRRGLVLGAVALGSAAAASSWAKAPLASLAGGDARLSQLDPRTLAPRTLGATPASTGTVTLDPHGVLRKPLVDAALKAMDRHGDRITRKDAIYLVDFTVHSSKPRLFRLDLETGQVRAFRTAHGLGSDRARTGYATRFSNVPNSDASSLGAYVTLGQSVGARDGANVLLDGLDSTNSEARNRAIIVHAAQYCEIPFLDRFGQLGRSDGCFALSHSDLAQVRPDLDQGRLIYAAA
ncbi:MAG TPA: murein L,D-transpeptidase catalytic domain family protein [Caulobacteraceae bacterium]|jgi:hypothetical protein|nr:murein L,D-transpeptidase catalytic domain family protein [Caulobacteraceae bacterium]